MCCLNLFLFPCVCIREQSIRTKHVRIVSLHRTPPLVDTSSSSLRSVGTLMQCAHKGDAVGSSRINCVVRSSLLRFASVSCVCFFTRHCLLFEPTIYLGSARRRNACVQALNVPAFAVSVPFRHLFRGRVLCAVSEIL